MFYHSYVTTGVVMANKIDVKKSFVQFPRKDYQVLGISSISVVDFADKILRILRNNILTDCSAQEADALVAMFCSQQVSPSEILCFPPLGFLYVDDIKRLDEFSDDEQKRYIQQISQNLNYIANAAKKVIAESDNQDLVTIASFLYDKKCAKVGYLGTALRFPSRENIYVINGYPVITLYGFVNSKQMDWQNTFFITEESSYTTDSTLITDNFDCGDVKKYEQHNSEMDSSFDVLSSSTATNSEVETHSQDGRNDQIIQREINSFNSGHDHATDLEVDEFSSGSADEPLNNMSGGDNLVSEGDFHEKNSRTIRFYVWLLFLFILFIFLLFLCRHQLISYFYPDYTGGQHDYSDVDNSNVTPTSHVTAVNNDSSVPSLESNQKLVTSSDVVAGSRKETAQVESNATAGSRKETEQVGPNATAGSRKETEQVGPNATAGSRKETVQDASNATAGSRKETAQDASNATAGSRKETVQDVSNATAGSGKETVQDASNATAGSGKETVQDASNTAAGSRKDTLQVAANPVTGLGNNEVDQLEPSVGETTETSTLSYETAGGSSADSESPGQKKEANNDANLYIGSLYRANDYSFVLVNDGKKSVLHISSRTDSTVQCDLPVKLVSHNKVYVELKVDSSKCDLEYAPNYLKCDANIEYCGFIDSQDQETPFYIKLERR